MKSRILPLFLGIFTFSTTDQALAQRDARSINIYAVGIELGYAKPTDVNGTIGFGVQADIGEIFPALSIIPSLKYWSSGTDGNFFDLAISEFSINTDFHYYLTDTSPVIPYIGAGLGLFFLSTSVHSSSFGDFSERDTRIGFNFSAGARFAASDQIDAFGEIRAKVDAGDGPNVLTVKFGIFYLFPR